MATRMAKLTPPSTRGLLLRERLLQQLDAARGGRLLWVGGPGGSGKTSLVASWIESRKLAALWYHMDPGDDDPATFFHYLALAAEPHRRGRKPLPRLTPEYLLDMPTFARRFFEAMFERLPHAATAVFDNFHRIGIDSPLQALIGIAMEQVPADSFVVFVSRSDVPPVLARWSADAGFSRVTAHQLAFDGSETQILAEKHGVEDPLLVSRLGDLTRGWTAGLVLLLRAHRDGLALPAQLVQPAGPVFEYFANEVFARLGERMQRLLIDCAVVRDVTPAFAAALAGEPAAGDMLDALHANQFFVERRSQADGTSVFEFHPILRGFLEARLTERPAVELHALRREGAELLEEAARFEEAIALLVEVGAWAEVSRLIQRHADPLLAQGRGAALAAWITRAPADVVAEDAWLSFWLGMALLPLKLSLARLHFEQAYQRFQATGNPYGAMAACSGALRSVAIAFYAFNEADVWIARLEALAEQTPHPWPIEIEAMVLGGATAIAFRALDRPMLERWAERAIELIRIIAQPHVQFELTSFACLYYQWRGKPSRVEQLLSTLSVRPEQAAEAPLQELNIYLCRAMNAWIQGEPQRSYAEVDAGIALADRTGIHIMDCIILLQAGLASTSEPNAEAAAHYLELYEQRARVSASGGDRFNLLIVRAGVALMRGELDLAARHANAAMVLVGATQSPWAETYGRLALAPILLLKNDLESAEVEIVRALATARRIGAAILEFPALIDRAHLGLARGDHDACIAALRAALAHGQANGYMNSHPWWQPELMSRLLGLALEHDIEPDYVRRLIRKRGLAPPAPAPAGWPFLLRIRALGEFEVLVDDQPIVSRKVPRKALELLKVVLALGGTRVSVPAVIDALWPLADGDGARTNFDTTLHRLRKLLGRDDILALDQGRLSLHRAYCWSDVWAFETLQEPANGRAFAQIEPLFAVYRGSFLTGDDESSWLLPARERLRSRFLRHVQRLTQTIIDEGRPDQAAELLARALELEPLGEALYRQLMALQMKLDRHTEAMETYHRCRHILSVVLGIAPSQETENAYLSLQRPG